MRSLAIAVDETKANVRLWGSTALRKLEDNTLTISDLLRERANQLTIQMTRKSLNDMKNQLPLNDSTVVRSQDLNHHPADQSNGSIKTEQSPEETLVDLESIQRQTLVLIPLGMKLSVVASDPLATS